MTCPVFVVKTNKVHFFIKINSTMNALCLTDPNIHPDLPSVGPSCLTSSFADVPPSEKCRYDL